MVAQLTLKKYWKIKDMSIQKYKAFIKTIEHSSVTKAAEELGYTQSAVSKMISDLEQDWNMKLIHRYRSGAVITSDGIAIMPHIRDILNGYDNLQQTIVELQGLKAGTLRIGSFTSLSTNLLPMILKSFHEKHPNVQIKLFNGEYNDIIEWLRMGTIDCGFVALPVPVDIETTPFFIDSLVAVVPTKSNYARNKKFYLSDLAHETLIHLKEEKDHEIKDFIERSGVMPANVFDVTNDYSILSMVESGLGVSIIHDLMLYPMRYNVLRLPLDKKRQIDIALATKKDTAPSSLTRMFMDHALSNVGKYVRK